MEQLISHRRSLIVAADVPDISTHLDIVKAIAEVPEVAAIKIGFSLAFKGLKSVADMTKILYAKYPVQGPIRLIYDHQKAGTDIPDTGTLFARELRYAGIDSAILFPFAGPETQEYWTKACQDQGIHVMVGSVMTHKRFLESEGGYIVDSAPRRMVAQALMDGVTDFVIPGTKEMWVKEVLKWLAGVDCTFYSPGFFTQGRDIALFTRQIGDRPFHPIVGREIYTKKSVAEMRSAARSAAAQLG